MKIFYSLILGLLLFSLTAYNQVPPPCDSIPYVIEAEDTTYYDFFEDSIKSIFLEDDSIPTTITIRYLCPSGSISYAINHNNQQTIFLEGVLTEGKPNGLFYLFDVDSRDTLVKAHFANGQLHGEVLEYTEQTTIIKHYYFGQLEGKYQEFIAKQLRLSGAYFNGCREGFWKYYDENGIRIADEYYKNCNLMYRKEY